MKSFLELKRNLKYDFSGLMEIKLAVLCDSASQLLCQSIRGFGYEVGINFIIYEADYDQIELQIFDKNSELYTFKPEYVLINYSSIKFLRKFGKMSPNARIGFADGQLNTIKSLYKVLQEKLNCKVLITNLFEIQDSVYGNFSAKTEFSFIYQLRKLNFLLMNFGVENGNSFIVDINALQSNYGSNFIYENKIYINTEILWSIDFLPILSKNIVDIINAIRGKFKKCLIIDLDNTMWGGIIGDDGIEKIQIGDLGIGKAFTDLQLWFKQLKERGIILAICSKNNEEIAKEPFLKHPDMQIHLDDIAVFVANWNNKVDNIIYIQQILNIGFDSMVFIDDNPFERNMVREAISDILVPELPEDPSEYLSFLQSQNIFETASFTKDDLKRTQQYQEEAKRVILQNEFSDENEFLKNLNMISKINSFNEFNTPRVSQLTQRSNQFNLRTIRYTEEDVTKVIRDKDYFTLAFDLSDKFGEYGLISLIILKRTDEKSLFIDTWIMSCRVLKRGMEKFVLNEIVRLAIDNNFSILRGEYIPTPKNSLVKNHYEDLGFKFNGKFFELILSEYVQLETFINKMSNE